MKDKPDYIQRGLWEAGSRSRISALQKLLTYKLNDVYSHQYASSSEGEMSVAYRSTWRPTIGQPLSVDISTDISVECQSTYRQMLDRYVGRYIERHISVDISTDTRPICRPTYRSTLGRYVDRYVGGLSVDMSTDNISVEGCKWNFMYLLFTQNSQT